jgi:curved DNA-binding protein CbpA
MSIDEAYRILNLRTNNKYTKDQVMKSYKSIMKKIHPDISPELTRLASIVNEAKDIVLKNLI